MIGCEGLINNKPSNIEIDESLCAVQYMRKLQGLHTNSSFTSYGGKSGLGSSSGLHNTQSNTVLSSLLTTAHSKASSLLSKATSFFIKFTPYYITRVVDNLSEGKKYITDYVFI